MKFLSCTGEFHVPLGFVFVVRRKVLQEILTLGCSFNYWKSVFQLNVPIGHYGDKLNAWLKLIIWSKTSLCMTTN